jgi:hypothetical protein
MLVPGALLFLFGFVYPHLLNTDSFIPYLYSAPVGLVPCPTLSVVIGLALILDGLGSRAVEFTMGIAGLIHGVIGAARLHVTIDLVMLAGAILLIVAGFVRRSTAVRDSGAVTIGSRADDGRQ